MRTQLSVEEIQKFILDVPDFPKKGIVFKDITPLLENHRAFTSVTKHFIDSIKNLRPKKIVAVESRGFIFGAALSQELGIGLVLARKKGKLPRETVQFTYDLEYGTDTIEIHKDSIGDGDEVLIVDDVLATGGTAHAVEQLCKKMGANILGLRFLLEIESLKGSQKLSHPRKSLISY